MLLITGNRGFVGRHLTKRLDSYGIKWVGYDLLNGKDTRKPIKARGIDKIIHLAALAGVPKGQADPEGFMRTNILGTKNVIDFARKHNISHLIFFSSASVYGNAPPPIKETDETNPLSVYGLTKQIGEILIKDSGVPYTIIRPFNLYGEDGRRDQVIYKWIDAFKEGRPIIVNGDGTSKRGYTYIEDLVSAVVEVLGTIGSINHTINLGSPEGVSLNRLANLFAELGAEVKYQKAPSWDIYQNWADISRAQKLLGYKMTTTFLEKAKEIIKHELGGTIGSV